MLGLRLPDIVRLRLRSLFVRNRVERELDEELQYHLEREIDRYAAAGMSADEARWQALRALGAITQSKEECRDMRGVNWIDNAYRIFDMRCVNFGRARRSRFGEASCLVGAGAVLGVGGSIAAATLLRGLFYGVRAWEVPTLAVVTSVLVVAALLASYIPARHAAATNPIEALRSE